MGASLQSLKTAQPIPRLAASGRRAWSVEHSLRECVSTLGASRPRTLVYGSRLKGKYRTALPANSVQPAQEDLNWPFFLDMRSEDVVTAAALAYKSKRRDNPNRTHRRRNRCRSQAMYSTLLLTTLIAVADAPAQAQPIQERLVPIPQ